MTIVAEKPAEPGRPLLWFSGAALLGFALPVIMTGLAAAIIYFPVGSVLQDFKNLKYFVSAFGLAFVLITVASGVLFAGAISALSTRRWRPLILALLFGIGVGLGFVPALFLSEGIRTSAIEVFARRSMTVVAAIEQYARTTGKPPEALSDLVPTYLDHFPRTGMAAYPDYEYRAGSGACSIKNTWHLWVEVHEFIDMNRMLYCPAQDYASAEPGILSRTKVGAWVHDNIDF